MSLRMIPNLAVYRPADAVETAECWALALERRDGPSLLCLTRQNVPQLRQDHGPNQTARGAYRLRAASAARRVVLIATGSEVEVALQTAEALEGQGIGADIVSMPCWSLFDAQDQAYRADLLPEGILKVSIEAGTTLGWERYVGSRGRAVGLDRFGASAPAEDLFKRFGFTAEAIVPRILAALKEQGDQ
jgi:transketolase